MDQPRGSACCVCGASDSRALVEVSLVSGVKTILCGSHALMHSRTGGVAASEADLRASLGERRGRRDRRMDGDELGAALTAAFSGVRRTGDRRSN
jgi:hypothetical protein